MKNDKYQKLREFCVYFANGEPFNSTAYRRAADIEIVSSLLAELDAKTAALEIAEKRVNLMRAFETDGQGLRYSLECFVVNGVNIFAVYDEEDGAYISGDDWKVSPDDAMDAAVLFIEGQQ